MLPVSIPALLELLTQFGIDSATEAAFLIPWSDTPEFRATLKQVLATEPKSLDGARLKNLVLVKCK